MRYVDSIKERLSSLLPMWLLIILVATWSVVIQDGHINRDGLLYLKQAYLIAEGSWKEGLALYPWPFFSILIAIFHKVYGLHLQVVAHTVDLILFGISAWFYLKTLKLIYKQKHIIFYGGIILLSFIPIMDDYVSMVLRDHGLWAGCMMGTYFYFKNIKERSLKNSLMWQLSFLFAGLFRPEGLVFLILIPLWNLLQKQQQRIKQFAQDFGLIIMLGILSLISIFILGFDVLSFLSVSRLTEFTQRAMQFLMQLSQPLPLKSSNYWLSNLLENYGFLITYSVLISILLFKWIKGLGILHGGLLIFQFIKSKRNDHRKHLYFFLIVSFVLVSVNLFNVYVLTNRYWGFHWWWIFILITPVLLNLIGSKKSLTITKNSILILTFLLVLITLIDQPDNLEKEVAGYIRDNNLTEIHYGNNDRINYYLNYQVSDLMKKSISEGLRYKVIKLHEVNNIDTRLVIKNFPEQKPKFVLIKND